MLAEAQTEKHKLLQGIPARAAAAVASGSAATVEGATKLFSTLAHLIVDDKSTFNLIWNK
jgi:hypothetical protein